MRARLRWMNLDSWREKHTDCAKNFSGSSKANGAGGSKENVGQITMLNVMANLWLESTLITVNTIKQADLLRVSKANAIQSATVKRKRKLVSTAKKVERHQQELSEGPTYGAGMDI
ncbi:unnamed protein product [Gadus morhua 'NCC']